MCEQCGVDGQYQRRVRFLTKSEACRPSAFCCSRDVFGTSFTGRGAPLHNDATLHAPCVLAECPRIALALTCRTRRSELLLKRRSLLDCRGGRLPAVVSARFQVFPDGYRPNYEMLFAHFHEEGRLHPDHAIRICRQAAALFRKVHRHTMGVRRPAARARARRFPRRRLRTFAGHVSCARHRSRTC